MPSRRDRAQGRVLLIEHGANRGGLAAARQLHAAGWTVDLLYTEGSLARRSRTIRHSRALRGSSGETGTLVAQVAAAVAEFGSDVVFPVDENQVLALSEHRDRIGARFPFAEHAVLVRATDRYEQVLAAERAGLAPPRTVLGADWTPNGTGLVAVKSRTPVLRETDTGWSRFETALLTPAAALEVVADIHAAGAEAIVQEVMPGQLTSLTVLLDEAGELVACEQQVARRTWPPEAGTSSRAETVAVNPSLFLRCQPFLADLGWTGLAQLQFLLDEDGTEHLIDFNPRFYGSLSLAIRSGASFPELWAVDDPDVTPGQPVLGRAGVRYSWLGGDLRRALREREDGLVRDLARTCLWSVGAVRPVWSARDPVPALAAMTGLVGRRLSDRARDARAARSEST